MSLSFIMRPHAQHFDDTLLSENLIYQPVLDVDAARICPVQIAEEFFKRRWIAERIVLEHREQFLHFFCQRGSLQFLCIFLRLLHVHKLVFHKSMRFEPREAGVRMPLRMDSRIPGIDRR